MSDYIRVYNLTLKDSLPTGNSNKVIKGTELDVELNAVAAAIASKADSNDPTFTGTPLAPTASYGTNTTQLATTAFVQAALQALYPVGSVYINATVNTNPATLLGFGTWITVGDGKVLVNQDTADTAFDTLGETGGSKNAINVAHTHTATSTSTSSVTDPGHTHQYGYTQDLFNSGVSPNWPANVLGGGTSFTTGSKTTGISVSTSTLTTIDSTGSSGTNANLQPYVVVKMWKRTA